MHVKNSQGSGCSWRSKSHSLWARTPNRGRGCKVPQWCDCGLRTILQWFGAKLNPDTPFYDEKKDKDKAGMAQCETNVDQVKMELDSRVSKVEVEIRVIKRWGLG
ncbi:hypothetical protein PIB30_014882 [Stylosanthes scabra]|uniref:Uncharacterized protein n=1 Tax=Stylosanthes scabra TaxID=79078 RepID=A0ABU6T7L3_9FABA|nr:hypothetical protein [Stylosanthes scabra]